MKNKRHLAIRDIIKQQPIETQEELVQKLKNKGFKVTQATISRDIKELRLIKTLTKDGKYCYAEPAKPTLISDRLLRMLREPIVSITSAENLIVIKTLSGAASAAAEAIDNLDLGDVVGTIAGDNTILIIVSSKKKVNDVMDKFNKILR